MKKKKDVSRRINYDAVSALLSADFGSKKKKGKHDKAHRSASDKTSRRSASASAGEPGYDSWMDSDGDGLSGLERMTDEEWNGGGQPSYYHADDGYDSDAYQQEA